MKAPNSSARRGTHRKFGAKPQSFTPSAIRVDDCTCTNPSSVRTRLSPGWLALFETTLIDCPSGDHSVPEPTSPSTCANRRPDTAPLLAGTISAALAAGESVQVLRNGVTVGTATTFLIIAILAVLNIIRFFTA